ncbi:MAG: DUF2911 domain-containing protein [Balneolaceae bacterium]|nr:DUF2911 domain-containing protein [Balneolaceae bacterium]
MKTLSKLLTVALVVGLSFGCAQSQNSGNDNEANDQSVSVTFGSNHDRENKEARPSPNAAVSQTIGTTQVVVTYGRPGVKGRTIFGDLEAYGEVWRTGANEATAVTFSNDVTVEGKELKAGTYSLYTIPGENTWTVIFNSKQSWGTEYDESKDVLRVEVQPEQGPMMEWFMIYFENLGNNTADMVLHWNKTKVPVTIEA